MNAPHSRVNRRACLCGMAAGLLVFGACSNTTAPTTTTPTPTTPTTLITPATTVVLIGQTLPYSLPSAASTAVVTWTSSNTSVLTIDSTGLATGIASGAATITATPDTGTASTLAVQVVPNYQGTWAGNATVLSCTPLDGFKSAGYCTQIRGSVQQWTLTLTQSGLDLSGTMTKSEGANVLNGTVSGAIGGSGDIISMKGPLAGLASGANLVVTPISWDSFANGGLLTGSWAANVTSQQILGSATVQWSLSGTSR
jgi:hypothetical protein